MTFDQFRPLWGGFLAWIAVVAAVIWTVAIISFQTSRVLAVMPILFAGVGVTMLDQILVLVFIFLPMVNNVKQETGSRTAGPQVLIRALFITKLKPLS